MRQKPEETQSPVDSFLRRSVGWEREFGLSHSSSGRHPFSKACLQHIQTVVQPCMWFLHDGTGWALCCLAHRELAGFFHEPHTGLEDCLRMLQAGFRKRMSTVETVAARHVRNASSTKPSRSIGSAVDFRQHKKGTECLSSG